jgi:hypothetical protein
MKAIKYIAIAVVCALSVACQKTEWDVITPNGPDVYGNNSIKETNCITIKQLKERYAQQLATTSNREAYELITEDLQIKGYVTCNDIEGNMYKEIAIEDETSAISICINQGGINGYLPLGTEILIDLKGLYVGNYRYHPVIGTLFTDKNGATYASRMSYAVWNNHFTYTGNKKSRNELAVTEFANGSAKTTWGINDAGKLGILRNVTFKNGSYYDNGSVSIKYDENATYASGYDNSISWYFNEQPTTVMLYNSCYARFAANKLPQGKVNITGILKRYNNYWEIIIRDTKDIQSAE